MAEKRTRIREQIEKGIYREMTSKGPRYIVYIYFNKKSLNIGSFATLAEAKKEKKKKEGLAVTKGEHSLATAGKKWTVEKFTKDWKKRKASGLKPHAASTLRSAETIINRYVIPSLGAYRLSDLSVAVIEKAFNRIVERGCRGQFVGKKGEKVLRLKQMSAKYQKNILQIIRQLTADMKRLGYIPDDFGSLVEGPVVAAYKPIALSIDIITKIVAGMREPYRSAGMLSLLAGMRQGELLALTWDALDLDAGIVRITQSRDQLTGIPKKPKTEAGAREIPLSPETVALLRDYRERQKAGLESKPRKIAPYDGPFLFPAMRIRTSKYEGRLPVIDPSKLMVDYKRSARIVIPVGKLPTWHHLRHVFASLALSQHGLAALTFVSACLGHSNPKITLGLYSRFIPGEASDHLDAVAGSVFGSDAFRQTRPIPTPIPETSAPSAKRSTGRKQKPSPRSSRRS